MIGWKKFIYGKKKKKKKAETSPTLLQEQLKLV
jgi:hypothetical protein